MRAVTTGLPFDISPTSPTSLQFHHKPPSFPYHVLYGLDGDEPGFLEELAVSLKSILLNAPLDDSLEIHLLASAKSYAKLDRVFENSLLDTFRTRNPITIHAYNVQPLVPSWEIFLIRFFQSHWKPDYNITEQTEAHTIGTFFRLFAHHVLPDRVQKILYLDNDAILMANLQELWKDVAEHKPNALFHWDALGCAGFVVFDNHRNNEIWDLAANYDLHNRTNPNDQEILRAVNISYPETVGILPSAWDVSVANEMWKFNHRLVSVRPNIGMMHFNGGKDDPRNAFKIQKFLAHDNPKEHSDWTNTWHLARYYANMPWEWARYWAKSMVKSDGDSGRKEEGYPIKFVHHEGLKPPSMDGTVTSHLIEAALVSIIIY
jgi:hypothetical protein